MSNQSTLSEELARVLHRKRRAFRFTQADLGGRIDVSGSYISGLENGKTSPRIVEIEGLATHFRTTAFELLQEAHTAGQQYVAATTLETGGPSLDEIAAELSPAARRMARDFLIFLREREKVDGAASS